MRFGRQPPVWPPAWIFEEADDVTSALKQAKTIASPSGLIVVTGSIYVVGEAMQQLGVSI